MNELNKYIGREFNEDTKKEIEDEFNRKIRICDLDFLKKEVLLLNQIRCVVVNGKIFKLQFN